MSRYLIDQIERDRRITVHPATAVRALVGTTVLASAEIEKRGGKREELAVSGLFSFIGAEPDTDWLENRLAADEDGFILTGVQAGRAGGWVPMLLETSLSGIFAAGDVRRGSLGRVATAVGEGAMVVRLVHSAWRHRFTHAPRCDSGSQPRCGR